MALGQESYSKKLDKAFWERPKLTSKEQKVVRETMQQRSDALLKVWISPEHAPTYAKYLAEFNISVDAVLSDAWWLKAQSKKIAQLEREKQKAAVKQAVSKLVN